MKNQNGSYLATMLTQDACATLARLSGVLGRWGCAVEALVVSKDSAPALHRITCVFAADSYQAARIAEQTARFFQVEGLELISQSPLRGISPLKVRIACAGLSHADACRLCERHSALISGRTEYEMTIEAEATPAGLALFLNDVAPYGLLHAEVPNVTYLPLETAGLVSGA